MNFEEFRIPRKKIVNWKKIYFVLLKKNAKDWVQLLKVEIEVGHEGPIIA